jgi:hypothetical protein
MCPKCASSTQSTSQIQYTLAKMVLPLFIQKSLAVRERERASRPLKQFFPPERAAKKYMCVLQVVLLFKLKTLFHAKWK